MSRARLKIKKDVKETPLTSADVAEQLVEESIAIQKQPAEERYDLVEDDFEKELDNIVSEIIRLDPKELSMIPVPEDPKPEPKKDKKKKDPEEELEEEPKSQKEKIYDNGDTYESFEDEELPDLFSISVEFYESQQAWIASGKRLPKFRHYLWWVLHNSIIHPLVGLLPFAFMFYLHDVTFNVLTQSSIDN